MGVGFASYEIPRSGLFANERGLYVTGHNIANVNTPGYVRQQAMITTGPYQNQFLKDKMVQMGLGADIQQIRQIRHSFLDNMYRQENTTLGNYETRNKTLQDVQAVLGEPMGTGMQSVLNQFWDSWQELSKDPSSLTVRALVRQRAESFTQQVNHFGEQLDKMQKDLNSEVSVRIDEINQMTSQISKLNVEIMKVENAGDTANDFRDQRNLLIDKLTRLANTDVNEMGDGQVAVTLGGYFLVNKGIQTKLYAGESNVGGLFLVPKIEGSNITVPINSGALKGILESRGEVFGAAGSPTNGSPYAKTDITFVIDNSNGSDTNLANIKSNIAKYVSELNKPGVDFNLRFATYNGTSSYNNTVYTKDTLANFFADINAIPYVHGDSTNNFGGAGGVVSALDSINDFRSGAGKYALVFTGESINGNEGSTVSSTDIESYSKILADKGIKTSIVTDNAYFYSGDSALHDELGGWEKIAGNTGGKIYDIGSVDFGSLMTRMAMDSVNNSTSNAPDTNYIIPDIKKRLNALVNVVAREINFLHKGGKNLRGEDGKDFFQVIDSAYPLEMGNIKLNDILLDVNNIVASSTGARGDNNIALKIAGLRHVPMMNEKNGVLSMDEYYQSIITDIGNEGQDTLRVYENQLKLVETADNSRTAITGVSMDEEMTNMMKYKFAYDAASRALNVVDEMLESVITRLGLVGR